LRFTTAEAEAGDDMLPGTRIPAVFVNNDGSIGVRSQVGDESNFAKNIKIDAKTWIEVVIKQYADFGKVMYEVIVDGNSVTKTENTKPTKYKNVKVWAARGDYYPAASSARIKNLMSNGSPIEGDEEVCLPGWTLNSNNCRCYKLITTPATWTDANIDCQRIAPYNPFNKPPVTRRHLAAINNTQENDFVAGLTNGKYSWIGGFKFADEKWGWTDGQKWIETKDGGYTNWRFRDGEQVEPNNFGDRENSLLINWGGRGLWNDSPYENKYPYVCQYLDLSKLDICRRP